jgi:hypothetical protein
MLLPSATADGEAICERRRRDEEGRSRPALNDSRDRGKSREAKGREDD